MFDPIRLYRFYNLIYTKGHALRVAILLSRLNYFLTGCLIPATVCIGRNPRFPDFGSGVVLNAQTVIGNDVMILPNVVLGQNVRRNMEVVEAKIIIGNNVVIGAGAKIIATGVLTVGDHSVIGANAVVLKSVPANCMAIGVPAHYVPYMPGDEINIY